MAFKSRTLDRPMHRTLLCFLLCLGISCFGCEVPSDSISDWKRLRTAGFQATANGTVNGTELSLHLSVSVTGDAQRTANLQYQFPNSMGTLEISAVLTVHPLSGSDPTVSVAEPPQLLYSGISRSVAAEWAEGLLAPAIVLLSLETPASVQKGSVADTLVFSNGTVLLLTPEGLPSAVSSEVLSLTFTEWIWE